MSQDNFNRELILTLVIANGNSGSWVIVGDRLLGTVVGGQHSPDCAYVLPIEVTFASIQRRLKAKRVALPTFIDNKIAELMIKRRESRWTDLQPESLASFNKVSGLATLPTPGPPRGGCL